MTILACKSLLKFIKEHIILTTFPCFVHHFICSGVIFSNHLIIHKPPRVFLFYNRCIMTRMDPSTCRICYNLTNLFIKENQWLPWWKSTLWREYCLSHRDKIILFPSFLPVVTTVFIFLVLCCPSSHSSTLYLKIFRIIIININFTLPEHWNNQNFW